MSGASAPGSIQSQYECEASPLSAFMMIPFFPEGSGVLLHLLRGGVLISFVIYYEYQRKKLTQYAWQESNNIMLPILSMYIVLFISVNILVTITSAFGLVQGVNTCASKFVNICIALQTALFHLLYEGMAVFLCKYGIGIASIRSSLFVGLIWACVSFFFFFILSSVICNGFDLPLFDKYMYDSDSDIATTRRNKILATTFVLYESLLAIFYLVIWVAPMRWFYRRPAAFFYAKCNFAYQIYWIAAVCGYLFSYRTQGKADVLCTFSAFSVILLIFIMPYTICRALMIDSNYWQGLMVSEGNPTAQLYMQNNVVTATTLAERIGSLEGSSLFNKSKVEVLHFGQLEIDYSKGFISGGFSRIYFGTLLPNKEVAIKVIYAMELSPIEIRALSHEAQLLNELKHPNIVECYGICVMPPALALVCQFCTHGSLFTFLYKPDNMKLFECDERESTKMGKKNMMTLFSGTNLMPLIRSIGDSIGMRPSAPSISGPSDRPSLGSTQLKDFPAMGREEEWSQSHAEIESRRHSEGSILTSSSMESAFSEFVNSNAASKTNLRSNLGGFAPTTRSSLGAVREPSSLKKSGSRDSLGDAFRSSAGGTALSPVHESQQMTMENDQNSKGASKSTSGFKTTKSLEDVREVTNIASKGKLVNTVRQQESSDLSSEDAIELGRGSSFNRDTMSAGFAEAKASTLSLGMQVSLGLRLKMMLECATAISFMHEKGYVHCDLKSLNFLVTDTFTIKLADMGDARHLSPKGGEAKSGNQMLPSRIWAAPELLLPGVNIREAYVQGSDVYGLAIVLSELATCKLPHTEQCDTASPSEWHAEVQDEDFRPDLSNDYGVPVSVLDSIRSGWKTNPQERSSAADLCHILEEAVSKCS